MVKQSLRRTSQSMAATIKKVQPNKSKNTKQKNKSNKKPKQEISHIRMPKKSIRKSAPKSKVITKKQQKLDPIEARIACYD